MAASGVIPLGQIAFVPARHGYPPWRPGPGDGLSRHPASDHHLDDAVGDHRAARHGGGQRAPRRAGHDHAAVRPHGGGQDPARQRGHVDVPGCPGRVSPDERRFRWGADDERPRFDGAASGRPDGASVQVTIATQAQPGALIVPISALLASAGRQLPGHGGFWRWHAERDGKPGFVR